MWLNNHPKTRACGALEEFRLLRIFVDVAEKKLAESSSIVKKLVTTDETEFECELQDGTVVTQAVDVRILGDITDLDYDFDSLLESTFPNYERRSLLITFYGIFEYELSRFCECYSQHSGVPEKSKLKGSVIHRKQLWLGRYCNFNTKTISEKFSEIDKIRHIRNWCAHNYGLADANENDTIDYIRSSELADLDNGRLIIKPGFLMHFCDLCYGYFLWLKNESSKL